MDDFVQKLRMNSIYPSQGPPGAYNPFGPADLNSGNEINWNQIGAIDARNNQNKDMDMQRQLTFNRLNTGMQPQGHLPQIAGDMTGRPTPAMYAEHTPENTVLAPNKPYADTLREQDFRNNQADATNTYRQALLGEKTRVDTAKLGQSQQGLDIKKQDSATRMGRADIYRYKAEHPDHKFVTPAGSAKIFAMDPKTGAMVQEFDTGAATNDEIANINADNAQTLERLRQTGRDELQGVRGQQRVDEIGQRIKGTQDLQDSKAQKPMLPTQTRVDQNNKARQIFNTNPELAEFIKIDQNNGNVTLVPSGNPVIDQQLKDAIYGPSGQDIDLPYEGNRPPLGNMQGTPYRSGTPTSTTPTANDPLGLR